MNARDDTRIAGERTIGEWKTTCASLKGANNEEAWRKAYADFFTERLQARYFSPIDILRSLGSHCGNGQKPWQGEGFAIVALQCTLIEFLGATLKGQSYVHKSELKNRKDHKKKEHVYSESGDMFVWFLRTAPPFKDLFGAKDDALDFYKSVRCALLHEARTKNNWKILAESSSSPCIDVKKKIVYRNNLQDAFATFAKWYGDELIKNKDYQEAFIRKFDSLCVD